MRLDANDFLKSKPKHLAFLAGFALITVLGGCYNYVSPSTVSPTNSDSGDCGSTVVNQYNQVVSACVNTGYGVANCQSEEQSFLANYPGVNCRALQQNASGVGMVITASAVRNLLNGATAGSAASLYASATPTALSSSDPSQTPTDTVSSQASRCTAMLQAENDFLTDFQTKLGEQTEGKLNSDNAQALQSELDTFSANYAGVQCTNGAAEDFASKEHKMIQSSQ